MLCFIRPLNIIPEPSKALKEMQRVTQNGGTVASYIWDYGNNMEFLHYFWAAASELKQEASDLNEAERFSWNHTLLQKLFIDAGLDNVKKNIDCNRYNLY